MIWCFNKDKLNDKLENTILYKEEKNEIYN